TATQLAQAAQKESAAAVTSAATAVQGVDSKVAAVMNNIIINNATVNNTTLTSATIGTLTQPVFQVTSTPQPATLLSESSFTGTSSYRLAGPINIPTSCSGPPCSPVVLGEFIVGVNFALQLATASARFKTADGEIFSISIPSVTGGVPITISGNQVTFNGTV